MVKAVWHLLAKYKPAYGYSSCAQSGFDVDWWSGSKDDAAGTVPLAEGAAPNGYGYHNQYNDYKKKPEYCIHMLPPDWHKFAIELPAPINLRGKKTVKYKKDYRDYSGKY